MADDSWRWLILETSGRGGQVALAHGEEMRAVRRLEEARRHARDLAPAVRDLLREQGWQPRDVHGVVVSRGPGSYTGLRVGVMSAKAFAYATGCVLLGVETFAAIAIQAPMSVVRLDVLADAQQERVYVQSFQRGSPDVWSALTPLMIRPLAEWLADRDPIAWASGPGVEVYAARLPPGLPVVEAERRAPLAESLLRIALRRHQAGERDEIWSLEPLYLRPSAAETQWQARQGESKPG